MKKNKGFLLALSAMAATAFIIFRKRKKEANHILKQVSDEGYETAHDILFPQHFIKRKNLHYGPILP